MAGVARCGSDRCGRRWLYSLVEEGLELGEGGGLEGLGAEPLLQGLLEPLDFALGLRVVRLAVLLPDAQAAQFGLEGVAAAFAAGEPGGEDHPVVGQGRGRDAVLGGGGAERATTIGPVTRWWALIRSA